MTPDQPRLPNAAEQDGDYPRPQLVRTHWADLGGPWMFRFDDDDAGMASGWYRDGVFDGTIIVPFPPESELSGVGDTAHHRVAWYARSFGAAELDAAGFRRGRRLILHFGAVDYRCRVWVDGQFIGDHEGGHTPFWLDITDAIQGGADHLLVVRTEDDPHDVSQPRGKQDWEEHPHVIWYHRTSGIWQPVWLEARPALAVERLHWVARPHDAQVSLRVELTGPAAPGTTVRVELEHDASVVATAQASVAGQRAELVLQVPTLRNGQASGPLLWSPENPVLLNARVVVGEDAVASYVGLRTVEVARGRFLLNDRPYFVRSVLSQGYWQTSHLAAPSAGALRAEVELVKSLGFNAARMHQKFEDPRFLYWADRLGLLVWAEAPASFAFDANAVERTVREWLEIVRRDASHPSIVTWVPLNESWGVQHIAHDPRMQQFARSLVALTKALDPTRPVVSNDGWEQVDTDILAIHDYESDPDVIAERYGSAEGVRALIDGYGPAGRRLVLGGSVEGAPIMLTEFGGISFDVDAVDGAWGYSAVSSAAEFEQRLSALVAAVQGSDVLAGFCYTQLTDTLQETNGLTDADRVPKLPVERIRAIFLGTRT
ncbi:glycoside hydrolase family 2 [Microbacterium sp. SYP-A9085]|uniref:glycoside hydrolase family 2 protein n=1 Tax=Microbacterium sp. SYP-A9085 TaxID=2664454 RepID=UPI00129B42AE|nr:glycoside hydrolase family 2 TIM barrel-domain containing protein [Microbacterium sp. SYP-A9085]MRH28545.1 glycoside hydrolase family 2 [Microbacterium sp. SYP-A9085]